MDPFPEKSEGGPHDLEDIYRNKLQKMTSRPQTQVNKLLTGKDLVEDDCDLPEHPIDQPLTMLYFCKLKNEKIRLMKESLSEVILKRNPSGLW